MIIVLYSNFLTYALVDMTNGLGRVLKTSFFLMTAFTTAVFSPFSRFCVF